MGPAIFPYDFPTFFLLPVVLIVTYVVSVTDGSESAKKERALFAAQKVRSETGLGSELAAVH
jgi:cation/acetate symporter